MKPWGKHSQSKHSPNLSQGRESWKDPRPYVLILIIPFNIIKGELGRTAGALPLWKIHSFLGGQNLYWSKNEVYWSSIGRVLDVYWTKIIARQSRCMGRQQRCIGFVFTSFGKVYWPRMVVYYPCVAIVLPKKSRECIVAQEPPCCVGQKVTTKNKYFGAS